MHGHISSPATFIKTFIILLIPMAVTVLVATKDLGWLNTPIAMAIAICKTAFVVLFFMGLKYSSRLSQVWAGVGLLFFIILIGLTIPDYLTRHDLPGWSE